MTLDLMKIGDKKKIIHIDNDLSIKKRLLENMRVMTKM